MGLSMVSLAASGICLSVQRLILTVFLVSQSGNLPALSGHQLSPDGPLRQAKPDRTQPGTVGQSPESATQSTAPPASGAPQAPTPANDAPPVIFQSHGLEYEALTKEGITVMFAPLASRLRDFNIIQITVTNAALVSWTVRPSDFVLVRQDGTTLTPVSADVVVETLLQRADRDDVIKLSLLYENSIYGLSNFRSTNGYEKRREAAMAQFVNRGFKAAAEASAITLVPTRLKSGDSTDGAVFFENRTKAKGLGAGRLIVHTCGQTFIFETYGELKKR